MTTIDLDWGAMLPPPAPGAAERNAPNFAPVEKPSGGGESDGGARPIELPGIGSPERAGDNLRRCAECGNLAANGRCLAAARREIVASRSYTPARDWLRRCEGFKPLPSDPDQRPGRDRWPGL
jgi:hypothetical protein